MQTVHSCNSWFIEKIELKFQELQTFKKLFSKVMYTQIGLKKCQTF